MTLVGIAAALAVGGALGVAAAAVTHGHRTMPAWVLVAVGVAAALAGAMAARLAGLGGGLLPPGVLLAQAGAAAGAVTAAAAASWRGTRRAGPVEKTDDRNGVMT